DFILYLKLCNRTDNKNRYAANSKGLHIAIISNKNSLIFLHFQQPECIINTFTSLLHNSKIT
ncbi:TPA: hypothetical protein QFL93_002661, partial [Enterococcus faecium]